MTESAQVKVWTKSDIQNMIATRDIAVTRALVLIYSNQTEAEKCLESTVEENGVGFTGTDGEILTSFAKFYQNTGFLTAKQIAIARNKMKKYWKQILQSMEAKGFQVTYSRTK